MGAIVHGNETLACRCGSAGVPRCGAGEVQCRDLGDRRSGCGGGAGVDRRPGPRIQNRNAKQAKPKIAEPDVPAESRKPRSRSPFLACKDSGVALLSGVRIVSTVALAEAIRGGAAIKQLWLPGPDAEPHYRPSAKLAAFIRARDVFCRFPGCDVPAERCDIDHVVPWPYGPTHASNMNCKCRTHHVGKTFWEGWQDRQLPDGTVIWTDPTGSRIRRCRVAGCSSRAGTSPPRNYRRWLPRPRIPTGIAKMPKRRLTRAAEYAARIKAERAQTPPDGPGSKTTRPRPPPTTATTPHRSDSGASKSE